MSPSASELLTTKLKPAVSLASAISRPRLLSQIGDTALPKVFLVTAAAGFGKTTLLAQWYETVAGRAGWLSLDRSDQDPIGFLRYLIETLNQPGPIISAATESFIEGRATMDLDGIMARVSIDLARLQEDRIVFLDDYYLAETPVINDLMTALIERSPACLHIVIASRTLPALPVARLKARNALLEFSARELKFNQPETEAFIHDARKLDLGPSEMHVLNERTEGWAAGLQLASLYLKDSKDLKQSIANLSGGVRDITDYLATDVVRRLAPDVQEFLLRTSVLERMNAEICNALLNREDGQATLEHIEDLGLFLFPMDATREWYRYHHLFRDFLLTQLKRQEPKLVQGLYRKASEWFGAEGLVEEAVNMALESGDFDQAAILVESSAMKMIKNGHMPQVNRWIQRLPEQVINQRLRFPAYHCWALIHMGKCHQAETLLVRAEIAIEKLREGPDPVSEAEQERLQAELLTLRAIAAVMADDVERAYELSRSFRQDRPEFAFFAGCLSNVLGLSAIARGEFELAKASGEAARRFHGTAECCYGICYGHCISGLANQAQGRLSAAMEEFEAGEAEACRAVGPRSFSAAMPRVLKAVVLYERNLLDEAYAILEEDLPLVEECAYVEIRTAAFLAMAGILGARGQVAAALRWLDQAISVSSETIIDRTRALVNHENVRLRLMVGDAAGARRFARHIGIDSSIGYPAEWKRPQVFRALVQCRLLIAEGKAGDAISSLETLAELAAKTGRVLRHVQILTLLALGYAKSQQSDMAFATINDILRIGATEGYIRGVVDQGHEAGQIFLNFALEKSRMASLSPDSAVYLDDLCAAFQGTSMAREGVPSARPPIPAHTAVAVHGLVEALTDREMKVLHLLAGGASNLQIGESLNISVNTVRWHVANILSKLQVENRTQAASAAYSLGLIA